jgi:hypothetical protein
MFAPITAQFLIQMKDCVCTNHRPSDDPPGEVLSLLPGQKWLQSKQGQLEFTEACLAKRAAFLGWCRLSIVVIIEACLQLWL